MGMSIDESISWLLSIAEHEGEEIPIYDTDVKAIKLGIETMRKYQLMQANYEARLKADMVLMLRFLWNEIEDLDAPVCDYASSDCISKWQVHELIQQKINELKVVEDGNDNT